MSHARTSIRIAIIDDKPDSIAGAMNDLDMASGVDVVATSSDRRTAMKTIAESRPEMVVLDANFSEWADWGFARSVLQSFPELKIVAYTLCSNAGAIQQALESGIRGYCLKTSGIRALYETVKTVRNGSFSLDQNLSLAFHATTGIAAAEAKLPVTKVPGSSLHHESDLTDREAQVLRMVALGYSGKEVAGKLNISAKTVDTYKLRAATKLQLPSRAHIVKYAIGQGWMDMQVA